MIGYPTKISTNGATLRGQRFLCGDFNARAANGKPDQGNADVSNEADALWIYRASDVLVEHCLFAWGFDENLSVIGGERVTVQHCINAHSLWHSYHPSPQYARAGHGCGAIVGYGARDVLLYRNLHAHHAVRALCDVTALASDGGPVTVTFANIVIYNWAWECFKLVLCPGSRVNIVNCLFVEGPDTHTPAYFTPRPFYARPDGGDGGAVYFANNAYWPLRADAPEPFDESKLQFGPGIVRAKEAPGLPDDLMPADAAMLSSVLGSAGPKQRNPYERAIIRQVRERSGRCIDSQWDLMADLRPTITRKGYFEVRDEQGRLVSRHSDENEAIERSMRGATDGRRYSICPPAMEVGA